MMFLGTGFQAHSNVYEMNSSMVVVLAASSDIGAHLTAHYLSLGATVVGTYRSRTPQLEELEASGARLFQLDIGSPEQVDAFKSQLQALGFFWDVLISAPGLLVPIGPFFSNDFDEWASSVSTNSTDQLRVLHAIHPLRNQSNLSKVIFFAGGGTNGTFDNYSAYCLGKLALIKMTELIDSECAHLQVSIIGTGWVNTKIHHQTLAAGDSAGVNFLKTRQFMQGGADQGASLETIAQCIDWCLAAPRDAVGGRNFSLVYDRWRDADFIEELQANPGSYKLRRFS